MTALALIKHRRVGAVIRDYFAAETAPINLAVFRVVLYFTLLLISLVLHHDPNLEEAVWFSRLPPELLFLPRGVDLLFQISGADPGSMINPTLTRIAWIVYLGAAFTGMIGLFSRLSSLLVVISGFYALGVLELYGKVDHYHHWLWFAALLAASPCGDVFSVDSLLRRRLGTHSRAAAPRPSRAYALPLRFIWFMMGLIYFFAGFWKLWNSGPEWALSDNLKYMMHATWFSHAGSLPLIRLDRYPLLYKAGGVFTIMFELTFIFLLFIPRWRFLAPLGGIAFHFGTWFSVNIFFWDLILFYVAFIDWEAVYARVRRNRSQGRWGAEPGAEAIPREASGPSDPAPAGLRPDRRSLLVACVGVPLVVINTWFGCQEIVNGWPFACYPTFSWMVGPTSSRLIWELTEPGGQSATVSVNPIEQLAAKSPAWPHRISGLVGRIIASDPANRLDPKQKLVRLKAFWRVLERIDPSFRDARIVRCYEEEFWVDPARADENPIQRKLLLEWDRGREP